MKRLLPGKRKSKSSSTRTAWSVWFSISIWLLTLLTFDDPVLGWQGTEDWIADPSSQPTRFSEQPAIEMANESAEPDPVDVSDLVGQAKGIESDDGPTVIGPAFNGQVVMTQRTRGRTEPVRVQPDDEVWVVSARDSHWAPTDLSRLHCWRLQHDSWEVVELNDLIQSHASDKSKVTMLYVHGDRTDLKWATSRGLQFYQSAFQTVQRPPVRFVIFAWRAEKERPRPFSDFEIKLRRSVTIGETLATLLYRFEDRKIVVGGFSLGAQVVLSAMSKQELQTDDQRPGKYRVAVFGHVLNPDFRQSKLKLYPNNPIVQQTDVFLNQDDRAVKLSRLIERKAVNSKLSLMDFANASDAAGNPILIRDITDETIKKHSIVAYARSPLLNQGLADALNAMFEEPSSLAASARESDSLERPNSGLSATGLVSPVRVSDVPATEQAFAK